MATRRSIAPLTKGERAYIAKLVDALGRRSFRVKKCDYNAQRLIINDTARRLRYWEGEMDCSDFSVPHAWVTINGKIVDLTDDAAARRMRREKIPGAHESPNYYGTVISRRLVLRHVMNTNEWGPVKE